MDKCITISEHSLDINTLLKLFSSNFLVVRIPKFFSAEDCSRSVKNINHLTHEMDVYLNAGAKKIGINQYSYNSKNKINDYFNKLDSAINTRKSIFGQASKDPVYKVVHLLSSIWDKGVDFALELTKNKKCFAGIIRLIDRLDLHVDWWPLDGDAWNFENISEQISWNVYLQQPREGGELIVYDRLWEEEDEIKYRSKNKETYNYDENVITNVDFIKLKPETGDLILVNTKNYHKVLASGSNVSRLTVTSFVGLKATGELMLWS